MKLGICSVGALVLVITLTAVGCGGAPTPPPTPSGTLINEALVTAKGEIVPEEFARLSFNVGGTVATVAAKEGAQVKKGDILAQLDTTDLELQVKTAQDALALAEATLVQTKTPATPEEIAAAKAAYDSAVANLERVQRGPTQEDLDAAEAAYNSALAAYNRARNGPTAEELEILKSQLAKAKAALDAAQAAYDRAGGASNPFIGLTPQALQLQAASEDYQIALANYNKAIKPDAATVAQAQAQLAQAEAALQNLKDMPKPEDVAAAQAQVAQAKATLDLRERGARPEDIAVAEKRVEQARTALEQAQAALAKATLRSPMDGTVTEVSIRAGELAQPGVPVITIADLSNLLVKTTDLDEFGTARVSLGQPTRIRVNAFTDKTLTGKVSDIAEQAVLLASGDVSYPVTIVLDAQDPELRWGMTVKVEFQE